MNRLSDAPVRAERGRVAYLDMLRIAATVAIVMIHVAVRGWRSMDMHTAQWHALSFFSSISRWGTPIFVMISGALFLDERREVRLRRLFSKNILRILIAFVFWSAVYAVPFFLRDRSVFGLISNFLTGSYQLWFLYMIVGLYLITPLLRRITSDRSALRSSRLQNADCLRPARGSAAARSCAPSPSAASGSFLCIRACSACWSGSGFAPRPFRRRSARSS